MTASTIIVDYLGVGTHAARPVSVNVPAACTALYMENDTGSTYAWNGSSWVLISGVGAAGISQLTADVTAGPGTGSQAATLATVNANVGSFTYGSFTVNAKGLITAASSGAAPAAAANPTATAGPAAVNGAASTYMRSDAAPAIQKATAAQFGIVEVDNVTITATAGVISAPGAVGGTVTSVGLSVPASSIFGTTGSPVTASGTLGVTVTGTSGGIPYFDTTTTLSSSAALTANRLVLGGGAGAAPTVLGSLGTTTTVLHGNAAGAPTFGAVANADLANSTISGVALGGTLADLTATDGTVTFSGSYTGATARTVGLNLGSNNAWTKAQAVTPVALSISAGAVAVDASLSNNFTLTANASFTLSNPTNLLAGQTINIWITISGVGSWVMTLGSQYQAAGGVSSIVLSTATGAKDLLTGVSDTTSSITCSLVKAISH